MARGIARVVLVGNLTRDPELRRTPNGTAVCQLGVAVNSSFKDGSGNWTEKASFFDVVVWGAQGENCATYLRKGRQVAVEGRLDQRSWDAPDGTRRSKVEVIADTVMFIGGAGDAREGGRDSYAATGDMAASDDFRDIDFGGDEDIPF